LIAEINGKQEYIELREETSPREAQEASHQGKSPGKEVENG